MKKRYIPIIPIVASMFATPASAEVKVKPELLKVASKVDTDGDFLLINKFDKDLDVIITYGELLLDLARTEMGDIPADAKVKDVIDILGLDKMGSLAESSKKTDGAWNNKSYIYTGGEGKGLFSMYGGVAEPLVITDFAPETTDVAVQMRLNTKAGKQILEKLTELFGVREEMERDMNKAVPELGGMTPFEFIEKIDLRASIAIDIDRTKRLPLPQGNDAPGVEFVARIDDASWIWDLFGEMILKQTGLPWEPNEEDGAKIYTLPEAMAEQFMGYSPVIRVDQKYIWVASKAAVLEAAQADGKKLKDGAAYKNTMASLPKTGNALVYISKDLQGELVDQYEKAVENGNLADPGFKVAKPLVDQLISDLTSTDSGIAMIMDRDKEGFYSVLRSPFPLKNYYQQFGPIFQMALVSPIIQRQLLKKQQIMIK